MPNVQTMKQDVKTLNAMDLEELYEFVGELVTYQGMSASALDYTRENRFDKGFVCPHCGSINIKRYGKYKDRQRYKCNEDGCGHTFNDLTLTAVSHSNLKLETWFQYIKAMILGFSLRKSAEYCEVSLKTSFYMRHRILDAVREHLGIDSLSGIIEMDETFLPLSFKGNQKKSGFEMPRKAYKRGKSNKKRGISKEQVCIATALDRKGNMIIELACRGRITTETINALYGNRIASESTICTDSHKSYMGFSKEYQLEHIQIERGKHKKGLYHINRINSLHNEFKRWIDKFRGVSTKHLVNYLYWFKLIRKLMDEKEKHKILEYYKAGTTKFIETGIEICKNRQAIFIK